MLQIKSKEKGGYLEVRDRDNFVKIIFGLNGSCAKLYRLKLHVKTQGASSDGWVSAFQG